MHRCNVWLRLRPYAVEQHRSLDGIKTRQNEPWKFEVYSRFETSSTDGRKEQLDGLSFLDWRSDPLTFA